MSPTTSVTYCPQANEPGGACDPLATFDATVLEVVSPFCLNLEVVGPDGEKYTVENVPAAGALAKDPVPGCYQPPKGAAFPIGYVESLGRDSAVGGTGGEDDDEHPSS